MNITLSLAWNGEAQILHAASARMEYRLQQWDWIFFCCRADWVRSESKPSDSSLSSAQNGSTDWQQQKKKSRMQLCALRVNRMWVRDFARLSFPTTSTNVSGCYWVVASRLKMATRCWASKRSLRERVTATDATILGQRAWTVKWIDRLSDKQRRMGQTFFNSLRDDENLALLRCSFCGAAVAPGRLILKCNWHALFACLDGDISRCIFFIFFFLQSCKCKWNLKVFWITKDIPSK